MNLPKILIVPGSTRSGSINTRLGAAAHKVLSTLDCEVTRISLNDYSLPIYNGDLESDKGIPENAVKLARLFSAHDGILIVSPEYNGSLPPLLKNSIDWVSRVSSDVNGPVTPYNGKVIALAAASPGKFGGVHMLAHLRDIMCRLGGVVIPRQVGVGNAGSAFDDMDNLTDERTAGMLRDGCQSLVQTARLLSMK